MKRVLTADGIDHGLAESTCCLEAWIDKFEDGYVLCPILIGGGKCADCVDILETRVEHEENR